MSKKRIYCGLGKVLLAYYVSAGLRRSKSYTRADVADWAETLEAIATLRNCLVLGAKVVPKELASNSRKSYAAALNFVERQPLGVELIHLQGIELFSDQPLTAINLS